MSYQGTLPPPNFNLARHCLAQSADTHPDKTALIIIEDRELSAQNVSYAQLQEQVLRCAAALGAYGFARGSRIFLRLGNSIDYVICYLGAIAAGLVAVPASPMLSTGEVAHILKHCTASACITDYSLDLPELDGLKIIETTALQADKTADYADTKADDPAYLIYTSGTSGSPKGVLHAQRAIWGRKPMYRDWYDIHDRDIILHTGAFNWTYTLGTGLCDPWCNGATAMVYTGPRDVSVWPEIIEKFAPTIMASVPALYRQILKGCQIDQAQLASLRHCLVAGEALPLPLSENWYEATGKRLYEALGMSEISTYISSSPHVAVKPGSPGKPQQGRSIAILAPEGGERPLSAGEIGLLGVHVSDPGMMLEYWNDAEETARVRRDGWFIGGDLASLDEEGYVWFEGRHDDVMNALGFRVSPQEVENALVAHPLIAEAGVSEFALREDLSLIAAFIVPEKPGSLDKNAIESSLIERLAEYKRPKLYYQTTVLPRTANGKLMRKMLPELVSTGKAISLS